MAEVIDVVDIGPDFGREELAVKGGCLGPRITVQPSEVGKGEGLSFGGLLLSGCLRRIRRLDRHGGSRDEILSLNRSLASLFQLRFQFLNPRTHALKFSDDLCVGIRLRVSRSLFGTP